MESALVVWEHRHMATVRGTLCVRTSLESSLLALVCPLANNAMQMQMRDRYCTLYNILYMNINIMYLSMLYEPGAGGGRFGAPERHAGLPDAVGERIADGEHYGDVLVPIRVSKSP